jgi:superfamily II RNA helicase
MEVRRCACQVVAALAHEELLPAIVFLFSRRGCEQAVFTLHAAGVDLTSHVSLHRTRGCLIRMQLDAVLLQLLRKYCSCHRLM